MAIKNRDHAHGVMHIRRNVRNALILVVVTVAFGVAGYKILTEATFLQALYMTVITLSTVGYGEVIPGLDHNPAGRLFTIVLILAGGGILLYAVSSMTAFFLEGELTSILRRRKMERRIMAMKDHIVVCGVGTTGTNVAMELAAAGRPFVAIDNDPAHIVQALAHAEFPYIEGDATCEDLLIQAGAERAQGIITVLQSDKDNLVVTFFARQLNPTCRIVARGIEAGISQRLIRAGANAVVFPNHIGGLRMASEMLRPHVVGFLDAMIRSGESAWRFEEVEVRPGDHGVGKTLGSLRIRERTGLPVLVITEPNGQPVRYCPSDDTVLQENMRIVVLAELELLSKLRDIVRQG